MQDALTSYFSLCGILAITTIDSKESGGSVRETLSHADIIIDTENRNKIRTRTVIKSSN